MYKEILEVVEKYQSVVNSQDKENFDELFANNSECSLISITNEFRGKDAIYNDFLINCIQKAYSYIELVNDGIEVNMVSESLAIVVFKYHTVCTSRESGENYGIQGLETQVIIKEDGVWKLLHVHYSK